MKEDQNSFREEDMTGAVDRFKRSLISGSTKYFDVSEFEGIVEQLLEEGDLQNSEIAAKQGIQIHPNAVPLQLKYAQVLINKGKYEKSLQYLHFAEQVDANNPDVHLLKGSARMVMGNEPEALISFKKAIHLAGNEVDDVLYQIGTSYIQIGELKKAVYYFEKAVQVNPNNEMVLYDLGFFCDQLGKYKKSKKYYNLYLDIDPFSHTAWFNLGTLYNKTNKHKKAIEAYEFALALNDEFHMALFNIGNALANEEKFEEAILKYQDFLKAEPKNDDAHCYIGECYLNMEDHDKARSYYQKAIDLNKENDTAWFGIGLLHWVEQELDESIEMISKALEFDKSNSEYWLTLAKVNKDLDRKTSAIEALKQAARINIENTDIWITWAELYLKYEEPNHAIRILKKAIKHNSDAALKYRLVAVYLELKKRKEATDLMIVAMKEDFEQINYFFDVYPKALKSKRLKKIIDDFKKNNPTD